MWWLRCLDYGRAGQRLVARTKPLQVAAAPPMAGGAALTNTLSTAIPSSVPTHAPPQHAATQPLLSWRHYVLQHHYVLQDHAQQHCICTTSTTRDDQEANQASASVEAGSTTMTPIEKARALAEEKRRRPPWFLRYPRRDPDQPAPPLTEPEKQSPKSPYEAVDTVVAVKQQARISPKKLNLIARLVRGMSAHDAVLQCAVSDKKGGRIALELLKNALEDAKNKGMDVNQLVVDQIFVSKGQYLKRIRYHAKGRAGRMRVRYSHLTLVLREVEGPVINQVMVLEPYAVRLAAKAAKAANVHSNATAA